MLCLLLPAFATPRQNDKAPFLTAEPPIPQKAEGGEGGYQVGKTQDKGRGGVWQPLLWELCPRAALWEKEKQ